MGFICTGCSKEVGTTEVRLGKCPVCGTEKKSFKMDLNTARRRHAKEPREALILSFMKLKEYSEEFKHSSEECGIGDWIVVPKEKFDKTLDNLLDRIIEISKELNLKVSHQQSLKTLLEIVEEKLVA